ncbi:nucleoside triphosphate pyrophosphohydrolase [Anaerotruncus colihominis]|uniref:Alpha-D-phosphohexomutase alpha/beta/alpha domain-containing protein n=1 Tax=Anaerotruncus colihominis TaxID=169435 RepID=A0A3E3IDZ7_9FIRM|nr:hypothetical protein DXC40_17285 [Anaerotruncus colihominis]
MKVDFLCAACESTLNLASAALSPSYYYDSLPYCIIDAVFSIGVKYTSTQNVVKNYCTYYGLREYNTEQDGYGDNHTISQMIEHIESIGVEKSADIIFKNHQRTSTRNGILKAEAALRFAQILKKYGIETLNDITTKGLAAAAEQEILQIPGQRSGLSLRYFYMLSGDDSQAKPDRHVLRFLKEHTGHDYSTQQAKDVLKDTVELLKDKYPNLTVRLLDYSIWNYMAHRQKDKTAKQYHKLVRDRIPEIIEADGKACIYETLSDEDYIRLLDQKLNEELAEYQDSKSLEELSDLLEVMQAVVKARGWTLEELELVRADKAAKRGGFEKKILLREVLEN